MILKSLLSALEKTEQRNSLVIEDFNFLKKLDVHEYQNLYTALQYYQTDSDSLNNWLFTLPHNFSYPVVWFTEIVASKGKTKFVWLIGYFDQIQNQVYQLTKQTSKKTCPIIDTIQKYPPNLLFINRYPRLKDGVLLGFAITANKFAVLNPVLPDALHNSLSPLHQLQWN